VSKQTAPEQLMPHLNPDMDRRTVLKGMGLVVGAAALESLPQMIRDMAELGDALASPEHIISDPITALEPREHNEPVVTPKSRGEERKVKTWYARKGESTLLHLPSNTALWAEHADTPIEDDVFTSAGTAIITTAEGLTDGEQAYGMLFKGKDQVLAVGYNGSLYTLVDLGNKETKEWVRVVTHTEDDTPPSPVVATASWKDLEAASPDKMFMEHVVEGSKTLRELGHKPWAAVLPSTQMPDMVRHDKMDPEISPGNCAQDVNELLSEQNSKRYFITAQGDIVDAGHLRTKAAESLTLFTQLLSQRISGEPHPKASIKFLPGGEATFDFSVDPASLQADALFDTVFSMMTTTSVVTEGVTQRYIVEKIAPVLDKFGTIGKSPEDLFSNSLGVVGMLSLIREHGLTQKLETALQTIHGQHPDASPQEMSAAIEAALGDLPAQLAHEVMTQTARTFGVRGVNAANQRDFPRSMYPLVPVKLTDQDRPTRIDLRSSGISTNNPNVRYALDHAPAMEAIVDQLNSKLGKYGI
jgi:hypothetical protein